MEISIVMPAHNEEKRIRKTLEDYTSFFKKIEGLAFEILVVLNACRDNTLEVVKQAAKEHKEIRYLDLKKKGKGFAITEGFREALKSNAVLIGFVDADLATSPFAFYDLIRNIGRYDGIIASRYVKNAMIKEKQSFFRILVSRIGNFIIRSLFMFSYRDTQCGAKLFRRERLEKILPRLGMTLWAYDIDLLYQAKKLKLRLKEHPTSWANVGEGNVNLKKASIQVFLSILKLRIINSPFRKLLRPFKPVIGALWRLVR